jgi:hypothetical protein
VARARDNKVIHFTVKSFTGSMEGAFWRRVLGWGKTVVTIRRMMDGVILILEDDEERIARFTLALGVIAPEMQVVYWRSARKMLQEVVPYLPRACLISLDHDLYPAAGSSEDPGDGLEVAKFLAQQVVHCPVIIHSSNGDRARMMEGEFELAGCDVKMIAPLGSDWIESYWARFAKSMLFPL